MSLAHSTLAACNRHHHGAPAIVLSRGVGRVHVAGNPFDLSDHCSAADPPADSAAAIIRHRLVPRAVASPSASSAERPMAASGMPLSSRSEEHTSELQSLMRTSYAVFCLQKTNKLQ